MTADIPHWTGRGPRPYPLAYGALLLNGLLLLEAALGGTHRDRTSFYPWIAGAFAFAGLLLVVARAVVHDTFISFSTSVRVFYYMLVGVMFCLPGMIRGHQLLPEGFAVALPLLTLSAIDGPAIRRWILFSTAGFWVASASAPPPALPLVLAYGFSLLWLFAAAYFAETGDPFGLRGWWPAKTTLQLALLYFIPAAVVATLTWFLWPDLQPPARPEAPPPVTARAAVNMSAEQMRTLLIRATIWLGMILASIVLILIVRRRLGQRRRPVGLPKVFGMDLGDMQFFRAPERGASRGLAGERGRIVRLWTKWANDLGEGRGESETAREVAARVSRDRGGATPERSTLTALLEQAHYGPDEPTHVQAEAMKKAVRRDLKR